MCVSKQAAWKKKKNEPCFENTTKMMKTVLRPHTQSTQMFKRQKAQNGKNNKLVL